MQIPCRFKAPDLYIIQFYVKSNPRKLYNSWRLLNVGDSKTLFRCSLKKLPLLIYSWLSRSFTARGFSSRDPKEGVINVNGLFVITITPLYNGHII